MTHRTPPIRRWTRALAIALAATGAAACGNVENPLEALELLILEGVILQEDGTEFVVADMKLEGPRSYATTADARGVFEFTDLEYGTYLLTGDAHGGFCSELILQLRADRRNLEVPCPRPNGTAEGTFTRFVDGAVFEFPVQIVSDVAPDGRNIAASFAVPDGIVVEGVIDIATRIFHGIGTDVDPMGNVYEEEWMADVGFTWDPGTRLGQWSLDGVATGRLLGETQQAGLNIQMSWGPN